MQQLTKEFFTQNTVTIAKKLIGKTLQVDNEKAIIIETEAYKDDKASHAHKRTKRSNIMYDTHGYIYVYMIYGMYYCLNITTEKNNPGAVLIRALNKKGCEGPGKLCKTLNITKKDNNTPLGKRIKIIDNNNNPIIETTKRIGINKDTHLQWRFKLKH